MSSKGKTQRRSQYLPKKYFGTLSPRKKTARAKEIAHFSQYHWQNKRAYKGFATDKGVKTKRSSYTAQWQRRFPLAKSLESKAAATGVPLKILQKSYNRGQAAWRTGHRPGTTQQQWGYGRVHSFLMCGKTYYSADADLVRTAKKSVRAKKWWNSMKC